MKYSVFYSSQAKAIRINPEWLKYRYQKQNYARSKYFLIEKGQTALFKKYLRLYRGDDHKAYSAFMEYSLRKYDKENIMFEMKQQVKADKKEIKKLKAKNMRLKEIANALLKDVEDLCPDTSKYLKNITSKERKLLRDE